MDESVERAQFGAWVRRTRKAQGLSQEALAHMTGLAVNTISRVESTSEKITPGTISALRSALGEPPAAEQDRDTDPAVEEVVSIVRDVLMMIEDPAARASEVNALFRHLAMRATRDKS